MLEPYQRGEIWWVKGRIELNGRPISPYIRKSTEAFTEKGAKDWIVEVEDKFLRDHLLGAENALTFLEAEELYDSNAQTAGYLLPIVEEFSGKLVKNITPKMVRELGPKLYPDACTDYWVRAVITPVRAVINNAHDLGRCAPIRIKSYSNKERVKQDEKRGKTSRVKKKPGSWEWLLKFRQHADQQCAALAHFMFVTGSRVTQSVMMHPKHHLDLQNGQAIIPGAKGHGDRIIDLTPELVTDLANLPRLWPRTWERSDENLRVFGFADRSGPRKRWLQACEDAEIEYLSPHAAGRHGFGQEMRVRHQVDKEAAAEFGGWADPKVLEDTYTHAEGTKDKIHTAFRTGLVQAQNETGLKLLKECA